MGYFSHLAEAAFLTLPDGQHLFCHGGFLSRPYIIPDTATEERLYTKTLWLVRLGVGGSILALPFLYGFVPEIFKKPIWFLAFLAIVCVFFESVKHLLYRGDLANLNQIESRLPFRIYYTAMAQKQSVVALVLGFIGSLLFVTAGLWLCAAGQNIFVALICVVFFGICALAWGYLLYLKIVGNALQKGDPKAHGKLHISHVHPLLRDDYNCDNRIK